MLNLSKDCAFGSVATSAEFDTNSGKWTVKTADGRTAKCKYLIIAAGFAAKRYIPDYPSMEKFQGIMHHSSFWPVEGVDARGKKVAVIGTGASGVQIIQEWGPQVEHLTVFQRTPNLALPMGKKDLSAQDQEALYPAYHDLMRMRELNFAGFTYEFEERNTFEDSPEEREALYEALWKKAGFGLWLGSHKDYLFDLKANRCVYDFWRKKQMTRIKNPEKREILCPAEPPHPFGVKRPCLEQNFYEVLDADNVTIVDIGSKLGNAIAEFTEKGIKTTDGKEHEFDIIALATGFDITTGGMTNMGLKSIHGTTLHDEWKKAAYTYLGTTIAGYPNMFHLCKHHTLCSLLLCPFLLGRGRYEAVQAKHEVCGFSIEYRYANVDSSQMVHTDRRCWPTGRALSKCKGAGSVMLSNWSIGKGSSTSTRRRRRVRSGSNGSTS